MNDVPQSRFVTSFHEVDFSDLTMPMIVVYERPKDHPFGLIARIWNVGPGSVQPTDMAMIANSLEQLRNGIPRRFTRVERNPSDDPNILEVWI